MLHSPPAPWLILSVALFTCGCNSSTRSSERSESLNQVHQTSPTAGYVDDQLCAECHRELYDSYQEIGMAQSVSTPAQAARIENFSDNHYYHAPSDRHYQMIERDGELVQARFQIDASGEQVNRIEVKVDAVLGSGNHVRSYLYKSPGGEWFQMPLAWYTGPQAWRMNPGYDNANHVGFQRKITRECIFCHNAFPPDLPNGADSHWQPHIFADQLPSGIGCQRCHGPGQEHITIARRENAGSAVQDSIVNPAKLPAGLAEDVCLQCHLQPSSQILSELVRADRGEFSFRPGQSLRDFRALVDHHDDDSQDRFEINHHAYRMHQSRCYIESQEMSCTTCHDPHKKVLQAGKSQYFRDRCLACHQVEHCQSALEIESPTGSSAVADSEIANCVGCHMPTRRTSDVIHAKMTDHRIVAIPPSESERLAARSEPSPLGSATQVQGYAGGLVDREDGSSVEVYARIAETQLGNRRSIGALEAFVDARGEKASLLVLKELALAYRQAGDVQAELDTLLEAVQLYPEYVQTNLEMGMALAAIGQPEQALGYYRRALAIGPPLPETHVGIGMSMLARDDLQLAKEHFEAAVALRPHYPEALMNLGVVYFALEQWDTAAQTFRRTLAADPTFVEAKQYIEQISQQR